MKKIIPANLQALLVPASLLGILAVLTVFALNFGLGKISGQRDELAINDKNENSLKDKLTILNQAAVSIGRFVDSSSVAVPSENPAFLVLSQLKILGNGKSVLLSGFKVSAPINDEGSLSRIDIGFDVDGTTESVFGFLNSISTFMPITTMQKVKISQTAGAMRASVSLQAYWAPFPASLPKLTEPLKELSTEDNQLLTKLSSLTPPVFGEIVPTASSGRLDPFSF